MGRGAWERVWQVSVPDFRITAEFGKATAGKIFAFKLHHTTLLLKGTLNVSFPPVKRPHTILVIGWSYSWNTTERSSRCRCSLHRENVEAYSVMYSVCSKNGVVNFLKTKHHFFCFEKSDTYITNELLIVVCSSWYSVTLSMKARILLCQFLKQIRDFKNVMNIHPGYSWIVTKERAQITCVGFLDKQIILVQLKWKNSL